MDKTTKWVLILSALLTGLSVFYFFVVFYPIYQQKIYRAERRVDCYNIGKDMRKYISNVLVGVYSNKEDVCKITIKDGNPIEF